MNSLPLERDTAMRSALAHADREVKRWSDLAYLFLADFARRRVGIFTGEDVTRASKEWGLIQPPTTRALGSLYQKAQRSGLIEHIDNEGRRANGSPCARYRSNVRT